MAKQGKHQHDFDVKAAIEKVRGPVKWAEPYHYDHEPTNEELERWKAERKIFWKRLNINYEGND